MSRKYDRDERKKARREARGEAWRAKKRKLGQKIAAFCAHNAPPGLYWEGEVTWVTCGLICTMGVAILVFFIRCMVMVGNLYETKWVSVGDWAYKSAGWKLKEGAMMASVCELLVGSRIGFALVAVLPIIIAVNHYRHYQQGSMSIYLMKRLSNRWEYHRRNLALPAILLGVVLVMMVLTELISYGIYLLMTPAGCMPAGQWAGFWLWMIGGGL